MHFVKVIQLGALCIFTAEQHPPRKQTCPFDAKPGESSLLQCGNLLFLRGEMVSRSTGRVGDTMSGIAVAEKGSYKSGLRHFSRVLGGTFHCSKKQERP